MNLVLADSYFPSCSTKPQSHRKTQHRMALELPGGRPGPQESSSGDGTRPGQAPGGCCSGDHGPENHGHGRDTGVWEGERPHRHRGPKAGPLGQHCPECQPSLSVPRNPHGAARRGVPQEQRTLRRGWWGAPPARTQAHPGRQGQSDRRCQPAPAGFRGRPSLWRPRAHV